MNRSDTIALLQRLDVRPSRRLGQNFLVDRNLLLALVRDAQIEPGEKVLEVGPGTGALTRELLAAGADVTAIEFDRRLAAYLTEELAHEAHFRLVEGDACQVELATLMGEGPYRCIANLPYSASSPFLMRVLSTPNPPVQLHILLQREMAYRLVAEPSCKAYSGLSVQVGAHYETSIRRAIPPNVFFPPPDVASASVRLVRRDPPLIRSAQEHDRLHAVVRIGFSQRRKQLAKLLAAHYGSENVMRAFDAIGVVDQARAEVLTINQWVALSRMLDA